jgi:hypothetical protein
LSSELDQAGMAAQVASRFITKSNITFSLNEVELLTFFTLITF